MKINKGRVTNRAELIHVRFTIPGNVNDPRAKCNTTMYVIKKKLREHNPRKSLDCHVSAASKNRFRANRATYFTNSYLGSLQHRRDTWLRAILQEVDNYLLLRALIPYTLCARKRKSDARSIAKTRKLHAGPIT